MNALLIGLMAFAMISSGAMLGVFAGRMLPEHHLSPETRNTVTISIAVVGTMSALVIGLLISNANASFSSQSAEVGQIGANVVQLDRTLRRYGEDAAATHSLLQDFAAAKARQLAADAPVTAETRAIMIGKLEEFQDRILALAPVDDRQRWLKAEALRLAQSIAGVRWLLSQQEGRNIPTPFLILVVCWLSVVFSSFGVFAPRNMTAITALLLSAIAVSSGLLLIVMLDTPLTGLVHIRLTPLLDALGEVQR